MKNTDSVMITIAKCFLEGKTLPEGLLEGFDDSFLLSLFKAADRHEIAPILSEMLYKSNAFGDNSEAAKRFKQSQLEAFYRFSKQQIEIENMSAVLSQEKIPFIMLKGSVIRRFYPDAYFRTSCDIDVLVQPSVVENAIVLLTEKLGYSLVGRGFHDVQLVSPSGVHVELHFSLVEDDKMPSVAAVLGAVWDTAKATDFGFEMTNEMFLFYHIAHMAKHFEGGGCGIRPFIDLYILDRIASADRDGRDRLLAQGGLLKFAEAARELSLVWLEGKEPSYLSVKLQDFLLHGGAYGSFDNRVALQQKKKGGRVGYMLSRAFIPYERLSRYYPVLKKHRWLMPFMQVRRWFMLLRPSVAKMAKREIEANGRMEGSVADQMNDFLNEIGL